MNKDSWNVAVVGLGYVGIPMVASFGKKRHVIAFDINKARVEELRKNIDSTGEVDGEDLRAVASSVEYTTDPAALKKSNFIIVAVPTPIDDAKHPDLTPVIRASETVGENLSKGSIVVYESTVYPGVTEDICIPILEKKSGLKNMVDFKVGYSPERVNPGDREHTFSKITKIVSGQDAASLETVAKIYGEVVEPGVCRVSSIKVAEAAKVIENTQRDLNIALMNELALIFQKMGIDTSEVLSAAGTKWNFLKFQPGLVGGHCIGVDPYYLTYKAEELGYHPQVILAGRRINDSMGKYVAEQTIKNMIKAGKTVSGSRVLILGLSFKENIGDCRNTRVVDIYNELKEYAVTPFIYDPWVNKEEVKAEYGFDILNSIEDNGPYDAVVAAVAHRQFTELGADWFKRVGKEKTVVVDVKGIYNRTNFENAGLIYWAL